MTTNPHTEAVAAAVALSEKAMPPPWIFSNDYIWSGKEWNCVNSCRYDGEVPEDNAELIAASHTHVALLKAISADLTDALAANAEQAETIARLELREKELVATVQMLREYPDFDSGEGTFVEAMDDVLAGRSPAILYELSKLIALTTGAAK